MATEDLFKLHTASKNVYFSLIERLGKFFDFADKEFKTMAAHAINGVNTGGAGASSFQVSGDIVSSLVDGKTIRVRASTANDALYLIRTGSSFGGGNTTVNVEEAVSDATVDGTIDLVATPFVNAVERGDAGGSAASLYTAQINLVDVHNKGSKLQAVAIPYERVGADPIPGSDTAISGPGPLEIQFGKIGEKDIKVNFGISTKTTAGNTVQASAWLTCDGHVLDLSEIDSGATCEAVVILHGQDSASPHFTMSTGDFGSVNADDRFEHEESNPNFTTDRQYSAIVTITENGNTWIETFPFTVFP